MYEDYFLEASEKGDLDMVRRILSYECIDINNVKDIKFNNYLLYLRLFLFS